MYDEVYVSKKVSFNREKIGMFEYENQLFTVSLDKKKVEKHELSTIAILYTFSNNNIHYKHKDITHPPMGPPLM